MLDSARSMTYRRMPIALTVLVVMGTLAGVPRVARAQSCAGDCNNSTGVTSDEILTLADVALGHADSLACPSGIPSGSTVNVALVLRAVNKAVSGCAGPPPGCGNGVMDSGEDCDNGSICMGGTNAGTTCTAESDCQGQGICVGGVKAKWVCDSNDDCPNGACQHCIAQEGNGCAANCTTESVVNIPLVPGASPPGDSTILNPGTSGLIAYGSLQAAIDYPEGITRQLTIGKAKDGKIPVVLKAEGNQSPAIDALAQACICLRPVVLKTCGGTLWNKDGTPSTNCTPGYTAGDSVCASANPCVLAYGADNIGAGSVGCDSLDGINVTAVQDAGGETGPVGPTLTTLDGTGGPGSAVIYLATELNFIIGRCTTKNPKYGADKTFCTSDDPTTGIGVLPQVATTGTASCSINNANMLSDNTIGPFSDQGVSVSCSALAGGSTSGAILVTAFPQLALTAIQDAVVTVRQVAQ